jgi:predicted GNAT family N-acyltransferase
VSGSAEAPRWSITRAGEAELAECFSVRRRVFVEEQSVAEALDLDGLDHTCLHFVARAGERVVGTARLRPLEPGVAKVERVAVLRSERGKGIGAALMAHIESCARRDGWTSLVLSAQESALEFYARLGYRAEGERSFEAGIPHRKMRKLLH